MIAALVWFGIGLAVGVVVGLLYRGRRDERGLPEAERHRRDRGRLVGLLVIMLALFSILQAGSQRRATEQLQECLASDREAMANLVRDIISGDDARAALEAWLAAKSRIAKRCAE
jgi:hypothetical protein